MARSIKPNEVAYIRDNCLTSTDEEIAEALHRDVMTITRQRRKLGVFKTQRGKVQSLEEVQKDKYFNQSFQKLSEEQKKAFYKTEFTNSLYYHNLKEQFTDREIDFYLEEWGGLCLQFEDIVATEKRQIDELIKTEIMANRIRRNIKIMEDEIEKIVAEIEKLRKNKKIEEDPGLQERDMQLMNLSRIMGGQSNAMAMDLQKNIALRNELLSELNARRKDRIDQIKQRNTTFLGLVEALREKETREKHGKYMELVRLAKEKKYKEWTKPIKFPDGSKDCIIMDENSVLPVKTIDIIKDTGSATLNEFAKMMNKNVLLVEDDIKRIQFFQDCLEDNNISYASNVEKALKRLQSQDYDLICLDYDLGIGEKGDYLAQVLVDANYSPNAKFVVHSTNKDGSQKIFEILDGKRPVEVYPFDKVLEKLEETK